MKWEILRTRSGRLSYAAVGENGIAVREFDDVGLVLMYEAQNEFSSTLNDFLADSKKYIEAKQKGLRYQRQVYTTPSTEFRANQRKLTAKNGSK